MTEFESFGDLKKAIERREKRQAYDRALALAADGGYGQAAAALDALDLSDLPPKARHDCSRCYAEAAKRAAASLDLGQAHDRLRRALGLGLNVWHVHKRHELVNRALAGRIQVQPDSRWTNTLACPDCDQSDPTPLACAKCMGAVRPPATMAALYSVSEPYSLGVYRWRGDPDAANVLSRMIRLMKKQEGKQICHYLAYLLASGLREDTDSLQQADVLVPVPPDPERVRERGFDNVAQLAMDLEDYGLIPLASGVLLKTRATGDLRPLPRSARRSVLEGAFEVDGHKRDRVAGAVVLLVDDTLTSGSTLDTCAEVLLGASASKVLGATLARSESSQATDRAEDDSLPDMV